MDPRLRLIAGSFLIAILALLLHQAFATSWSNRCDPGNTQFYLMKNDPISSFRPAGTSFTTEADGPDNSWLCSDASLTLYYFGPNQTQVFNSGRIEMARDGWSGGEIFLKDQDFAIFQKDAGGVRLDADLRKELFWVELDMHAPGLHMGEPGFSGP